MLNRIRLHWRDGVRAAIFATAIVAGVAGTHRLLSDDCCYPGAPCCKPGAACCNGAHKVAQR